MTRLPAIIAGRMCSYTRNTASSCHNRPRACSTAHRSNRPDHWDGRQSLPFCSTGPGWKLSNSWPV